MKVYVVEKHDEWYGEGKVTHFQGAFQTLEKAGKFVNFKIEEAISDAKLNGNLDPEEEYFEYRIRPTGTEKDLDEIFHTPPAYDESWYVILECELQ